ncbi:MULTISPECIES: ABC transporter ATP-binding protein [unclassified Solwaraspora]|uniref:ABC transporter ATP-binding protein n=1 Tax=unclassified Solwaraspora TaxID=2627926 RepID=UPI00259AFC3A|nr:ABC transporter ATP-binding protein [Solwaraspora sp. WMMA2056]WJK38632.1 ABC transporter ATP-binding protein [Solwaraspora sp. WMMA2056]
MISRDRVTERWNIVRLAPRAGIAPVTLLAAIYLVLGLLPVAFIVATSVVIGRVPQAVTDGLGSPAWDALVTVFLIAAAAFVGQQILAPVATSLGTLVSRRIDGHVFDELMAASLRGTGVAALENQQVLNHLRTAARELEFGFQSPGQAVPGLLALIARYTQLTGYAVLVGMHFSWLAAIGLGSAVLLFRYGQRGGLRKYAQVRFDLATPERKVDYVRQLATGSAAGKEIRIFGLVGWLQQTLREAYLGLLRPVWAARRRIYLWPFIGFASWGLLVSTAVFAALGSTAEAAALTTFVLVMQAILGMLRLSEYYPEADAATAIGMHAYEAVRRFAAHADSVTRESTDDRGDARGGPGTTSTAPTAATAVPRPESQIWFDDVSFHYPGQDRPVLNRLNLTIPVGQCTAIVGLNGAGKTTLVKLLARLYEPTSGRIYLDGVDIANYPVDQWRARLGVIFQDFARYEASAADNIVFGAVHARHDTAGVRAAAEAVGLGSTLEGLPAGMDTPLARHLTGGVDLSGGQWQRVALARALFALRHGASIVVLDEPTASLDVRAEARFFDEFAGLTQQATTLLISHRFSSVRRADRIVVIADGVVIEQGGHDELMALGGQYARLFRLQADRFVDPAEVVA